MKTWIRRVFTKFRRAAVSGEGENQRGIRPGQEYSIFQLSSDCFIFSLLKTTLEVHMAKC